jgi:hypothetical protein
MTQEERRREICEIVKLADKVAALSQYRIWNVNGIRVVVAAFERWSDQVDVIEGGGESLARGVSRGAG